MKDFSVEAKIEAPFQLRCGKDDTKSGINRPSARSIGLQGVILNGAQVEGVFAEHEPGVLASAAESMGDSLATVELPSELVDRKKFIAEWALRAKKSSKKGGAFSVLLLPLAACGGGDSSSTSTPSTTGYVIDGYIRNAFLFRDEDGDGFHEVHVNTMEGFWSLLRSWLRPHRGISQEKLPLYLGFFEALHNIRRRGKAAISGLLALLLG